MCVFREILCIFLFALFQFSTSIVIPFNDSLIRTFTFAERKVLCEIKPRLVCTLLPTEGYQTEGYVSFAPSWRIEQNRGYVCDVRIRANMTNLSPGKHGMHIHTYGDMRSTDGSSTGGHFTNPDGDYLKHGFQSNIDRHWGDFDNIYVDESGFGKYNRVDSVISLEGIIGRGVTVHAEDDKGPKFQPSGAAGVRIATCVIGYANPSLPQI